MWVLKAIEAKQPSQSKPGDHPAPEHGASGGDGCVAACAASSGRITTGAVSSSTRAIPVNRDAPRKRPASPVEAARREEGGVALAHVSGSQVWERPCHNDEAWAALAGWLKKAPTSNPCAAIVGGVGTGKTSGLIYYAEQQGYCVTCIDVMDARDIRELRPQMDRADITLPVLFLIDDADGLPDDACADLRALIVSLSQPSEAGGRAGGRAGGSGRAGGRAGGRVDERVDGRVGLRSHRRLVMAMTDARSRPLRDARDACSLIVPLLPIPPNVMMKWYAKSGIRRQGGRCAVAARAARAVAEECEGDMRQFRLRVALSVPPVDEGSDKTRRAADTFSVDTRAHHPFVAATAAFTGAATGYELYGRDSECHALLRHNCMSAALDTDALARAMDFYAWCDASLPRGGGEMCYVMWHASALRATAGADSPGVRPPLLPVAGRLALTFPSARQRPAIATFCAAPPCKRRVAKHARGENRGDEAVADRSEATREREILCLLNVSGTERWGTTSRT